MEEGVLEDGYDSDEEGSMDQTLEAAEVPEWTEQLTPRALIISLILGVMFNFIIMRMSLTIGIIPSLNISSGLLAFFMLKSWSQAFEKLCFSSPFTRQENTIIQTCVIACVSVVQSGGFGSYLFAMSNNVAADFSEAIDVKNIQVLGIGSTIAFMFLVSIVGLFIVAPIAKVMIVGQKLYYPSGVAIAHLINSFQTSQGALIAKKQVWVLFKSLVGSFLWAGFKWMYSARPFCGFSNFPVFGMTAYDNKFYFECSASNMGMGMICPVSINLSLLLGGVISHAFLWPHIKSKESQWFPVPNLIMNYIQQGLGLQDVHGIFGYKVFISLAMVVGDGLFHLVHVLIRTSHNLYNNKRQENFILSESKKLSATNSNTDLPIVEVSQEEHRRMTVFLQDHIPSPIAIGGYIFCAIISIIGIPSIFHQLKAYHVVTVYLIAPIFAFCNAYGAGLTNLSLGPSYGKLLIFIMAGWVGMSSGGVIAGLASSGIIMPIVNYSSDILQDYKTGYLTLSSPKAMLISQIFGSALGCVLGPLFFSIFQQDPTLGDEGSDYPVPYAKMYRALALVGTEGLHALPDNCLSLCILFFFLAVIVNAAKELTKKLNFELQHYVPSVTGMAITFYLGPYVPISMCTGSLVTYLWGRVNKEYARTFTPALASGLMCGESLWLLPTLLMDLNRVNSPMCMKFFSSRTYRVMDGYLV
ncbi:Oligopeptide transporter OPT protein [Dioscorea alata]|uniref:Oligopeptide transporter OPT protein n=1 Tax=Dioscorea alata TaxID=55571 RepID=A0ACB7V763_DIOAL|nr:Oligopeptide transporter OPT protein [Dioscorea alata]